MGLRRRAVSCSCISGCSIGSRERIEIVHRSGAAGFTIGTAALEGDYPADSPELENQLRSILRDVAEVNDHLSPHGATNLVETFAGLANAWAPQSAGHINDKSVRLVKFEGQHIWHYHKSDDVLFLVHKGRMLLKFRDRDEILNQGEFIIVPYGVEHCPVALDGVCEAVMIGPEGDN